MTDPTPPRKSEPDLSPAAPANALESLLSKLDTFAESLDETERRMLFKVIDKTIDPAERVRQRAGDEMFDEEEKAFLESLESPAKD
jgi:hypothetical protein